MSLLLGEGAERSEADEGKTAVYVGPLTLPEAFPSSAPVCALGHLPPQGEGLRAATWGRPYGYHPDSAAGVNPRPTKFSRLKRLLFQVRRSRGIAIAAFFHPARAQWPGGNSDQPLRFCAPGILQNPAGTRLP